MSSLKTIFLQMHKWIGDDKAKRVEFVENFDKIDLTLKNNDTKLLSHDATFADMSSQKRNQFNYEIVAIDDFSNVDNFEFKDENGINNSAWAISNNKMTSPNPGSAFNLYAWHKKLVSDGYVEVTWENPLITSNRWFAFIIRGSNYKDCLLMLFLENAGSSLKVGTYSLENGIFKVSSDEIITQALNDIIPITDVPMVMRTYFEGNKIKTYINNRLVHTAISSKVFLSNMQGFKVGLCTSGAYIKTFSNFIIAKKNYNFIPNGISKIVCVGSSITAGFSTTKTYPQRLQEKFINLTVLNKGQNGRTTQVMLDNFITEVVNNSPNICIIEGSVNDSKSTLNIPLTTTIFNLQQMIRRCKENNIIPIITTATPINVTGTMPGAFLPDFDMSAWRKIVTMNTYIRKLALQENIILVDNAILFDHWDIAYIGDGLHPNDVGAQMFTDNIYNVITGKV